MGEALERSADNEEKSKKRKKEGKEDKIKEQRVGDVVKEGGRQRTKGILLGFVSGQTVAVTSLVNECVGSSSELEKVRLTSVKKGRDTLVEPFLQYVCDHRFISRLSPRGRESTTCL